MGMGLYGVKALRLGYSSAAGCRGSSAPTTSTSPTCSSACTGIRSGRGAAGNPASYDYGRMRETWLIHLCTDWMGDDAWLWKLDCQFRKFNYVGDTHWMRGRVTRKYLADGDRPAVDLDLWGENQRGETTTPGHATILLPSREHGAVRLPDPPGGATTCQEALDALAARFAAEEGDVKPYPDDARGPRRRARRPGPAARASTGPSAATPSPTTSSRAHRDRSTPPASDEAVRVIAPRRAPATTSAPASTSASGRRAESGPGSGSVHRRMRAHVNRLIPAMLETQTPDRDARRAGWVDRPRPRPRAGVGLRGRGRRRPAAGAVHDFGFTPDCGGSWLIPRLAGVARAKEMLLLGARSAAREAAEWGLVHRAVPDDRRRHGRRSAGRPSWRSAATVAVGLTKLLDAPRSHRRPRPAPRRRGLGDGAVEPLRGLPGVRAGPHARSATRPSRGADARHTAAFGISPTCAPSAPDVPICAR